MERPSAKHSLHKQSRPSRTPKQHLVVMRRMRKVLRLLYYNNSDYDYRDWYNDWKNKIRPKN
jgi:hypothetical protein